MTRRATVRAYDFEHDAFASACREGALAFMNGVAEGWTKRDLAMWLLTSYRALAHREAARAPERETDAESEGGELSVDACSVSLVMEAARAEVASRLLELREGEWTSVTAAMRERHVEPLRMAGELVWVPVHRARMRLADRVLSLFLVDYLHSADAYETDLAICASCARVAFDRVTCAGCARPIRSYLRELGPVDDAS